MGFKHTLSHQIWSQILATMLGLLLLLLPLTSCGTTPTVLQFVPINLGLPDQALNSPVVGPLPDTKVLHVRITFKISQNVLNRLSGQKIQPKQPSHLESLANQLGINDATYQKIKAFFKLQGIQAVTTFCQSVVPPRLRGITCSRLRSLELYLWPQ